MPHQPQAQHTQPYPSSNPQAYPNQAGYVPYDASFQQQRPTTPAMSPSRPKSAFQQVGPHGYGPQQSPMSAVSRNPYPPSLPFRPAPSVSSTSSYQHARPAGSVPYQAQSSDQGSMSAYTAPSAFTVNQSPVTGPKGASPVEHHGQGGGNAAKNAQHTSHAVAGPHQGDQPGPALDRPSAPKPTEAPSALAAPDNGQSDKRVEESGQERKKVKLNKKQRARARRAREDAANQMTAAQTATQAGTQEASQSTATETSVTAEASIDTASIPKVGVEDNHHPSVEPGGTQSQAAQQEPSGDNNEDKDAAVVDQTMHDASSTETDIHKGVTDDTTATAAPDKAATTGAEEVSNIDKGKAAATMVEEDTTTSFGGPSSGAVQPSASRPKVPFQLTKPQQPRTSLAHQAHQEVTAPAPASHTAGINSTSLEEDQVPGAAASSPTEELGGDKPKQDVGSSEVTDTVGSNPSAAPFSHQVNKQPSSSFPQAYLISQVSNLDSPSSSTHLYPQSNFSPTIQSTSYLASDPTPMEGTKATKAGQGNGQQNVALPEPVINTTRKKARKRAARRAQPTQTASAANDREQSIDSGATSPENATTENAADGATTENPGDNNPASATEDAAAPGAQLDTVELQFPKLPRLVVDQAATPGPSQFAPGRTCDCDLTPEGFGHHCKAGYNWDDFTAEMAREADAVRYPPYPADPRLSHRKTTLNSKLGLPAQLARPG